MLVKCVGNKGYDLPGDQVDTYGTVHTDFHITVGESYTVYGMTASKGTLDVLISDDTEKPNWHPIALFRVVDGRIPDHWEFDSFLNLTSAESEQHITGDMARWGYREIVRSEEHNIGLIEREYSDLRIFHLEQQRHT